MMGAAASSAVSEIEKAPWWVVCLCAGWCGVCREYRDGFEALARRRPEMRWHWLDVEEREDLVEDMDVETFPTLLIGRGSQAFFLGPLLPQHAVLERLLDSYVDGAPAAVQLPAEATPLFLRIAKALT